MRALDRDKGADEQGKLVAFSVRAPPPKPAGSVFSERARSEHGIRASATAHQHRSSLRDVSAVPPLDLPSLAVDRPHPHADGPLTAPAHDHPRRVGPALMRSMLSPPLGPVLAHDRVGEVRLPELVRAPRRSRANRDRRGREWCECTKGYHRAPPQTQVASPAPSTPPPMAASPPNDRTTVRLGPAPSATHADALPTHLCASAPLREIKFPPKPQPSRSQPAKRWRAPIPPPARPLCVFASLREIKSPPKPRPIEESARRAAASAHPAARPAPLRLGALARAKFAAEAPAIEQPARRAAASAHPPARPPLCGLAPWREPKVAAEAPTIEEPARRAAASAHPAATRPLCGLAPWREPIRPRGPQRTRGERTVMASGRPRG